MKTRADSKITQIQVVNLNPEKNSLKYIHNGEKSNKCNIQKILLIQEEKLIDISERKKDYVYM